jgi:hypothetical protein
MLDRPVPFFCFFFFFISITIFPSQPPRRMNYNRRRGRCPSLWRRPLSAAALSCKLPTPSQTPASSWCPPAWHGPRQARPGHRGWSSPSPAVGRGCLCPHPYPHAPILSAHAMARVGRARPWRRLHALSQSSPTPPAPSFHAPAVVGASRARPWQRSPAPGLAGARRDRP